MVQKLALLFLLVLASPALAGTGVQCPPMSAYGSGLIWRPHYNTNNTTFPGNLVHTVADLGTHSYGVMYGTDEMSGSWDIFPDFDATTVTVGIESNNQMKSYYPGGLTGAAAGLLNGTNFKSLSDAIVTAGDGSVRWLTMRWDLASREELATSEVGKEFQADWLLASAWDWADFMAWIEADTSPTFCGAGSDCRFTYCRDPDQVAGEEWDSKSAGCAINEKVGSDLFTLDAILERIQVGLSTDYVSYVIRPSEAYIWNYLAAVDMTNVDWSVWDVERTRNMIAKYNAKGVLYPHKMSQYYALGGVGTNLIYQWADITDSPDLGGISGTIDGMVSAAVDWWQPRVHRNDPTDFYLWDDYIKGYHDHAVRLRQAGVKYTIIASPTWFKGCDPGVILNADGSDPGSSCDDDYDCGFVAGDYDNTPPINEQKCTIDQNEAAMIRHVVMMADTVYWSTSANNLHNSKCYTGDCSTSDDLGYATGLGFYELNSLVARSAGGYHPRVYAPYVEGGSSPVTPGAPDGSMSPSGNRPYVNGDEYVDASDPPNVPDDPKGYLIHRALCLDPTWPLNEAP